MLKEKIARLACVSMAAALALVGCTPDARTGGHEDAADTGKGVPARVVDVYDGDTMTVRLDGSDQEVKVRVLGVDAPEMGRSGKSDECGAVAARDALREMAPEQAQVVLVADPVADTTDRYGRTLAYVHAAGRDLGGQLVADGLVAAWTPKGEPDPRRAGGYRDAMDRAREGRVGSWASCPELGR